MIDGATNTTNAIPLGASMYPQFIEVNSVANKIYVTNYIGNEGGGNLEVIDGVTNIIQTIPMGAAAAALAVNQVTNKIYYANGDYGPGVYSITVIDGATLSDDN